MAKGYKSTFTDRDSGYKRFKKQMQEVAKQPSVVVGIIGDKAQEDHDGLTNVQLGTIHEFGTEKIPERSFIRATVDTNRQNINSEIGSILRDIVLQKIDSAYKGLTKLGLYVQGIIQKQISFGIPPANSPETVARKGSSTPLVDTGQLRQAITYEVREK